MLIAELRRKLGDIEDIDADAPGACEQIRRLLSETKEDLLTADVFGALKYLPRRPYLESVLRAIEARPSQSSRLSAELPAILREVSEMRFDFWPTYPTPPGIDGTRIEPDLEISGPETLLFFEAKLHSGFGTLQPARELAVGLDQARGRRFFLVFVTPYLFPRGFRVEGRRVFFSEYVSHYRERGDIDEALAMSLIENSDRLLWLSWRSIMQALGSAGQLHHNEPRTDQDELRRADDIVADLEELMLMRNIRPFRGLTKAVSSHGRLTGRRPILGAIPMMRRYAFLGFTTKMSPGLRLMPQLLETGLRWTCCATREWDRGFGLGDAVRRWCARPSTPWRCPGATARAPERTTAPAFAQCVRRHQPDRSGIRFRLAWLHQPRFKGFAGVAAGHPMPKWQPWLTRKEKMNSG